MLLSTILALALLQSPSVQQKLGNATWLQTGLVPSGAIVFINSGSCPSTWTEVSSTGNYVLFTSSANGDAGTTGGSLSYTPAGTNATASFTPAGTIAWPAGVPTFSGSAMGTHSHGAGTLADATSANTVKLFTSSGSGVSAATLSGSTAAVSAGTPSGTVAWPAGVPTLTGTSGTIPAESFTGTGATIQPTYIKLIGCQKQ